MIVSDELGRLKEIRFLKEESPASVVFFNQGLGIFLSRNATLLQPAIGQLEAYFSRRRKRFDLELAPEGTAFQKAVWRALTEIPYGATWSYGEVADRLGRPRASRAVGRANGANPIPIVVPCHRVIGANGALVGFSAGLELKARLLELERGG